MLNRRCHILIKQLLYVAIGKAIRPKQMIINKKKNSRPRWQLWINRSKLDQRLIDSFLMESVVLDASCDCGFNPLLAWTKTKKEEGEIAIVILY